MAYTECMTVCILVNLLFIGIWTWFLNFLCKSGYTTISWILVILPFIMFILMILIVIELMRMNKVKENFSDIVCNDACDEAFNDCVKNPENLQQCTSVKMDCINNCTGNMVPIPPTINPMSTSMFNTDNM